MSRYFQQLLASSGLIIPPVVAPTAFAPRPQAGEAAPHEIWEERTAPELAAAVRPLSSDVRDRVEAARPRPTLTDTEKRAIPNPPSATAQRETGVVEIVSPDVPLVDTAPVSIPARGTSSPPPARLVPVAAVGEGAHGGVATPPRAEPTPPPAASAPFTSPTAPAGVTSAELIQHVLHWVGQNPGTVVPPALGDRPALVEPARTLAPAATLPEVSARTASPSAIPVALPSAEPASWSPASPVPVRPPAPAPVAMAQESIVEISIGTLQIHVDSPPAAKPVRRPTAPRPPARGRPAAAAPAIDLNRLRRGFYL